MAIFAWHERRLAADARRWGRHLLEAQDAERQRIARELHDDMVPRLYAVRLAAERRDASDADEQLGGVMADLRTMAHDLHPPALKHLDLRRALEDLVDRHQGADGLGLSLVADDEIRLDDHAAVALYRVAQEGLANVRRHAQASHAVLTLDASRERVRLTVRDDGRGMPDAVTGRDGFGLRSMRERLEVVGGHLDVRSVSPQGTELVAIVPA